MNLLVQGFSLELMGLFTLIPSDQKHGENRGNSMFFKGNFPSKNY